MQVYNNFINGAYVAPQGGNYTEVRAPRNGTQYPVQVGSTPTSPFFPLFSPSLLQIVRFQAGPLSQPLAPVEPRARDAALSLTNPNEQER